MTVKLTRVDRAMMIMGAKAYMAMCSGDVESLSSTDLRTKRLLETLDEVWIIHDPLPVNETDPAAMFEHAKALGDYTADANELATRLKVDLKHEDIIDNSKFHASLRKY